MDRVMHFEIPAENMPRAQKFYKNVFGWRIKKVPQMEYYMASTVESDKKGMPKKVGAINGALMEKDKNAKAPVLVITVRSVNSHLKKIERSGGKVVMEPQKVEGMGIYARVQDTEGNVIGIWQSLEATA
jgi:predicted enzyme related to lactoylglutathione lyase